MSSYHTNITIDHYKRLKLIYVYVYLLTKLRTTRRQWNPRQNAIYEISTLIFISFPLVITPCGHAKLLFAEVFQQSVKISV